MSVPGECAVGVRDSLGGRAPEEDARLLAEDRRHEVVVGRVAHVELDARLERGDLDESGATAGPGFVGGTGPVPRLGAQSLDGTHWADAEGARGLGARVAPDEHHPLGTGTYRNPDTVSIT